MDTANFMALHSIAFDVDYLRGEGDLDFLFEDHKEIEEVIIVVYTANTANTGRGEFGFVELSPGHTWQTRMAYIDSQVKANDVVVLIYDIYRRLQEAYELRAQNTERARTHRQVEVGEGHIAQNGAFGYPEEREWVKIDNADPPGPPETPFPWPVVKIMGMTRGRVRL